MKRELSAEQLARFVAPICLACLLLIHSTTALSQPVLGTLPALTTVREVRELTSEQAAKAHPVRLHGVVTVLSGWKSSFFFQDATFGISIDRADTSPSLAPGDQIDVIGVTGSGMFAPVIVSKQITILKKHTLPPAPVHTAGELSQGREDAQWLTIKGVVRSASVQQKWDRSLLMLKVDMGGGNQITASVHDFSQASLTSLIGATVSIRGVCATIFNDRRQFVGLRIFVADLGEIHVEQPPPVAPFDAPLKPLNALLQFDSRAGATRPVKVHGVVTYIKAGQGFYLQDGTGAAFIQTTQADRVAVGSRLEAAGYPAVGQYSPKLEDAIVRILGSGGPPAPVAQKASRMILSSDGFVSAPLDSILVQVTGMVIEKIPQPTEDILLLQEDGTIFTARVPRLGRGLDSLSPGSIVRLTGICTASADDSHEVRFFEILLQSPAGMTVLKGAPWWTPTHALWVVSLLGLAMLGMFGWIALARRENSLREMAVTDPLTNLYNRRGFMLLAQQQWQMALRREVSFLLFYIDVDQFKQINDSFGHKEGDLALQFVAKTLQETFRNADILGRLGGDEFAVAAVDASPQSVTVLKNRIATGLQQGCLKGRRFHDLTLSIGVLMCDSTLGPIPIEELLTRADALMYEQKHSRAVEQAHLAKPVLVSQQA